MRKHGNSLSLLKKEQEKYERRLAEPLTEAMTSIVRCVICIIMLRFLTLIIFFNSISIQPSIYLLITYLHTCSTEITSV